MIHIDLRITRPRVRYSTISARVDRKLNFEIILREYVFGNQGLLEGRNTTRFQPDPIGRAKSTIFFISCRFNDLERNRQDDRVLLLRARQRTYQYYIIMSNFNGANKIGSCYKTSSIGNTVSCFTPSNFSSANVFLCV
jgi:hypothetical protein